MVEARVLQSYELIGDHGFTAGWTGIMCGTTTASLHALPTENGGATSPRLSIRVQVSMGLRADTKADGAS